MVGRTWPISSLRLTMPHAEILAIGTELLLGEIVDTNSAHIARALRGIGLDLLYLSQIGDNEARIAQAVAQALARSDALITTGGLGPTVDDMTREAVARATGRPLELHPEMLAQIEQRFARWGRRMSANNRRQAMIPQGAIPIPNPVGTAPGFIVETERSVIISVPGVPREMEFLLESEVLPYLRRRLQLTGIIKARVLRTAGLGESTIDQKVADLETLTNPTVGLAAHPASVDVRITAKAASEAEADRMIAEIEAKVRSRLGSAIFGVDADTVEGIALGLLAGRGLTVAVAEAGTEGALAARLSDVHTEPPAFLGGVFAATPDALARQFSLDGDGAGMGPLAERAARAVAQAQGASLGLACLINPDDDGVKIGLGLADGAHSENEEMGFGGHVLLLPQWAATFTLDRLRRRLLAQSGERLAA